MRRSQPTFARPLALLASLALVSAAHSQAQLVRTELNRTGTAPAGAQPLDGAARGQTVRGPVVSSNQATQLPFRIQPPPSRTSTIPPSDAVGQTASNRASRSTEEAPFHGLPFAPTPIAATPEPVSPAVRTTLPGNRLLADAIQNIASHRSIAANIRHRVNLFGHELVGSGTYQQMDIGPDRLLRLELKIPLDDQITSVTQICDGRRLWTERTFPDEDGTSRSEISRIDLNRLRRSRNTSSATTVETGNADRSRTERPIVSQRLLLKPGGLPQIMVDLERHFAFHEVDATTLHDVPVWITWGTWKPGSLERILADADEKSADEKSADEKSADEKSADEKSDVEKSTVEGQTESNSPRSSSLQSSSPNDAVTQDITLPSHFPDYVGVILGQEDLLPYQFQYRRRNDPDRIDSGPVVPGDSNSTPIVTMELFQVEVGGAIDPAQFSFSPAHASNRRVIDRTREFLDD